MIKVTCSAFSAISSLRRSQTQLDRTFIITRMVGFSIKIGEKKLALTGVSSDTIWALKVRLQEQHKDSAPDAGFSRWVHKGKVLVDEVTLADAGIAEGDCVIVIKSKTSTSTRGEQVSPTAVMTPSLPAATASSTPVPASIPVPQQVSTAAFDSAMHELLTWNGDNISAVQACVATLIKVASNIMGAPMEDKFRRVPATNKNFVAKVGSLRGGSPILQSMGFRLESEHWVLVPSADAWEVLTQCHDKLNRFQSRLLVGTAGGSAAVGEASTSTGSTKTTDSGGAADKAVPTSTESETSVGEERNENHQHAMLLVASSAALALAQQQQQQRQRATQGEGTGDAAGNGNEIAKDSNENEKDL